MKTTITINLGGIVFHIDDDAYEMLNTYLFAVEKQFVNEDERKEVMSDIEIRLSELFKERLGNKRDVIMKEDVSKVIEIMGEPEDFIDEETNKQQTQKGQMNYKINKRLYRDPDNKVISGVCGGIGAYFGVDPIWFRLAFFLSIFFFASGIIIYLILWIVVPKARTTAEKLEMRGENVNISNIEKSIKEEIDELKKN
jgi:phage shock protein PspC (stress-responsive transcriptional regulator)